jgi:hypothetical protein
MEFIQGTAFKQLAEENRQTNKGYALEYAHTHDATELLDNIRNDPDKEYVVITHNSDGKIKTSPGEHDVDPTHMPPNIVRWFGQNVCYEDQKITSIPIGLENDYCFPSLYKIMQLHNQREAINLNGKRSRLIYLNHSVHTNVEERKPVYDLFGKCDWVTTKMLSNGTDYTGYLHDLATHCFAFCPQGNGTDTHRLWDALYLGCIPVVKQHVNIKFYTGQYEDSALLPIVIVDDWAEVTQDMLKKKYYDFTKNEVTLGCDMHALDFNYWRERILNA